MAQALALGALTEEQAAAQRWEFLLSIQQAMTGMEAGRFVPSPDADERRRIGILEVAFVNLDLFDRVGRAAVAAGAMTEAEFIERRQELVERDNGAIDDVC